MKKKSLLRTIAATAMTAALGLSLMGAPAQAGSKPVNITSYTVSDVVIAGGNCLRPSVKANFKKPAKLKDLWISAEVTRGSENITNSFFTHKSNKTTYQVCPFQGTGKYKIGKAKVSVTANGKYYPTYSDNTSKTFYVREASASKLSAKRSGKTVKLTAYAAKYSIKKYGAVKYSPKSAKVQVLKGKKWVTLKKVTFKGGVATAKVTASKSAKYRVTFPKTTTVIGSTSKAIKK